MPKKKFQNIQIFRIVACMGTFMVHFGQRMELRGILRGITDLGAHGVSVFFIISGFVAWNSVDDNKVFSAQEYWKKRCIKILPIYYLIILYNFILHTYLFKDVPEDICMGYNGPRWLRYIFFLNILLPYEKEFWNNICATWTIKVFVLFYLLVPIVRKLINSFPKALLAVGVMFLVGKINFSFINTQAFGSLCYFFVGVALFYCIKEHREKEFIVLLITHFVYSYTKNPQLLSHQKFIVLITFCVFLLISMEWRITNKNVVRLINILDEYSYTIYLVHAVFIDWADRYKEWVLYKNWRVGTFIILIGGTIVGSMIIHSLYEIPVQKFLLKGWKKKIRTE